MKTFKGPRQDVFQIKNQLATKEQLWTPCGRSLIIDYGISLSAISNAQLEKSIVIADGLFGDDRDSSQPIQFELRRCH